MRAFLRFVLLVFLVVISLDGRAQDPDLDEGRLVEGTLDEAVVSNEGTETLLLDNTRSKIGREFYDAFFRHYAELPKSLSNSPIPSDTTAKVTPNLELDLNAFLVTIDELPAFGVGTTIISVTLNDQLIWQNYVQARLDIVELYAYDAAEVTNQFVLNFKEVQQSLESEDQKGSGLF
ncbi:hypothetical protein [Spirosoma fluminis]